MFHFQDLRVGPTLLQYFHTCCLETCQTFESQTDTCSSSSVITD